MIFIPFLKEWLKLGKIRWKNFFGFFLIVLIIIISVRINNVNESRHHYETFRKDVQSGDKIRLGDLEFTIGQASSPIVKDSVDYPNKKIAVYNLPIEVTKKSNRQLGWKDKFAIYESYKDFHNLALVNYSDKQNKQDIFASISSLKDEEVVNLTVSTDFIIGDFYDYYDYYNVEKPAYIVIAGPQSPKGTPLYYYKLQQKP